MFDLSDIVKRTIVGTVLGMAVDKYPIPETPTEQAVQEVENAPDAALYYDLLPSVEYAPFAVADSGQEPTPAAFTRAQRAAGQWHKVADLPMEPGVYESHIAHSRQICHLIVYPANKAESRMEFGLHCGVDSTPKAEK